MGYNEVKRAGLAEAQRNGDASPSRGFQIEVLHPDPRHGVDDPPVRILRYVCCCVSLAFDPRGRVRGASI